MPSESEIREREMKQTIRDQVQLIKDHETIFKETKARLHKRIKELEDEQLGQQVADEKVKYALAEVARAEKNDIISRQGWQQAMKLIQMATSELEKHDCSPRCDGTPETALAILKTKI
jgi:hypothetical protein